MFEAENTILAVIAGVVIGVAIACLRWMNAPGCGGDCRQGHRACDCELAKK